MSVTKQSKYNWDVHLPRLVEFYLQGLSFPEIHKAAVTPDFKPSEKTVYNKLTQEGYPADKIKREAVFRQLKIAQWPCEIVSNSNSHCARLSSGPVLTSSPEGSINVPYTYHSRGLEEQMGPAFGRSEYTSFPQHASEASTSIAPLENHGQNSGRNTYDNNLPNHSEWAAIQDDNYGQFVGMDMTLFGTDFQDITLPPSQETHLGMVDEACDISPRVSHKSVSHSSLWMNQEGEDTFESCDTQKASGIKFSSHQQNMPTPVDVPDLEVMDTPSPFSTNTFPATPQYAGGAATGYSKPRPLDRWNPKFGASKSVNPDRNSSSTFDSGYGSGRSSPFSFQAVERPSRRTVPVSAPPFNGLHRVPCKGFHEPRKYNAFYRPQPTGRYREVDTCHKCKYSAIHNLSWSAQYLKFEVFETELKLPETYVVTALDAAGNSALHYAAIGGADLEVIASLIQFGVDPCQINTSGELFLHCLRPCFDQSIHDFEKCLFPTFRTNLVNLLNVLDPKYNGFFRWRDKLGKTALERFVSGISDNDLRSRIRETVTSAGYPLHASDRSKNEPLSSRMYTFLDTTANTEGAFDFNKVRQRIAKEITRRASTDPTFVHPETGDNILHALARLRSQESADLISRIQREAANDVDLNLCNFDQDGPLSVFTQEPPADGLTSEETGATISKYLDALLWKDPQKRIPNKINVNMRNREDATPLYYAAIRARPDSVRSLIEAGANVNVRLEFNGQRTSILLASEREKDKIDPDKDPVRFDRMNNVISYLEHANAVIDPTEFEERRVCGNTVGSIAV